MIDHKKGKKKIPYGIYFLAFVVLVYLVIFFFKPEGIQKSFIASGNLLIQIIPILLLFGRKPLGIWPGIWGLIVCIVLYIFFSLRTQAPREKAEEFIQYLNEALPRGNFF